MPNQLSDDQYFEGRMWIGPADGMATVIEKRKQHRSFEDSIKMLIHANEIIDFDIPSQTDASKSYLVTLKRGVDWQCACFHFRYRRVECKHIRLAQLQAARG